MNKLNINNDPKKFFEVKKEWEREEQERKLNEDI
jgi:hypothetical protein